MGVASFSNMTCLQLLDFCVKNSGPRFAQEALNHLMVDDIVLLIRDAENPDVRDEALRMIALWGTADNNSQEFIYVRSIYSKLRSDGECLLSDSYLQHPALSSYAVPDTKFPVISAAEVKSIKYDMEQAPAWIDSAACDLCRNQFTVVSRQHHCRACGKAFCGECSKKSIEIPKFGFIRPVRVCDLCYDSLTAHQPKPEERNTKQGQGSLEDQQIRLALEISEKEYNESLAKASATASSLKPADSASRPADITHPQSAPTQQRPALPPADHDKSYDLSPAYVESIKVLPELISRLKQSASATPGGMIEIEGIRALLDEINGIRLVLVKNISACNTEIREAKLELDEIENLESLWSRLVDKEMMSVSSFYPGNVPEYAHGADRYEYRGSAVGSSACANTPAPSSQQRDGGGSANAAGGLDSAETPPPRLTGNEMTYGGPPRDLPADRHGSDMLDSIFGAADNPEASQTNSPPADTPSVKLIFDDDDDGDNRGSDTNHGKQKGILSFHD